MATSFYPIRGVKSSKYTEQSQRVARSHSRIAPSYRSQHSGPSKLSTQGLKKNAKSRRRQGRREGEVIPLHGSERFRVMLVRTFERTSNPMRHEEAAHEACGRIAVCVLTPLMARREHVRSIERAGQRARNVWRNRPTRAFERVWRKVSDRGLVRVRTLRGR